MMLWLFLIIRIIREYIPIFFCLKQYFYFYNSLTKYTCMKKKFTLLLLVIVHLFLFAQIPNYYDSIDFSKHGDDLKKDISSLISATHTTLLYYSNTKKPDVWKTLKLSDLDPENLQQNTVLLIYGYNNDSEDTMRNRMRSVDSSCHKSSCKGLWTREHVFAKSLANPKLVTSSRGPGTDAHNLRAVDQQYNIRRSNRNFAEGKGISGNVSSTGFYPGDEWKGSVARIIMYMHVRYPYQCEAKNTAESTYTYSVEMPDLYLKWNAEKDPSLFEKLRNEVIYSVQGNRNPFIDNPYIATLIWGGPSALNTWGYMMVDEMIKPVECKVYPTVTSDNFIYIKGRDIKSIYIYNVSGNLINHIVNFNDNKLSIPNQVGIYFIKLVTKSGNQTFKIIKKP